MKKSLKVLSAVLAAIMLFSVFSVLPAGAADSDDSELGNSYYLWIGNTQVTDVNKNDILGDGGKAKFDPETDTLTLNDPNIKNSYDDGRLTYVIYTNGIYNLTVKGSYKMSTAQSDYAINSEWGSLTLEGDFAFVGVLCGIYTYKNLIINGGTVTSIGKYNSNATQCNGTLTITNNAVSFTSIEEDDGYALLEYFDGFELGSNIYLAEPSGGYITDDSLVVDSRGNLASKVVFKNSKTPGSERKIGDVNNDNAVDVLDSIMIQKYAVDKQQLTDEQKYYADVNNDGDVNVFDAIDIQKFAAGKITEFKKKS